jgi:N-acetylmuramoyl-L-alanine amidase
MLYNSFIDNVNLELRVKMTIKTTLNYSTNFDPNKRVKKNINFLVFHYTGMRSEKAAINRLTNIQSKVASHYLIKKNGKVITLVPDLYIAWHAGISSWKNYKSLNKNSIGVEITNPGHQFGYKKFSKKQINSLINLSNFLIKKYKISKKNILGHSDIAPKRKKDPGEKFPWEYLARKNIGIWHNLDKQNLKKLRKKKCDMSVQKQFLNNLIKIGYSKEEEKNIKNRKYPTFVIKAFQRRFRPELINGEIDQECLLISQNLI